MSRGAETLLVSFPFTGKPKGKGNFILKIKSFVDNGEKEEGIREKEYIYLLNMCL